MPHYGVIVDCDVLLCLNNKGGECSCTCDAKDLQANDLSCSKFSLTTKPVECRNLDEAESVLEIVNEFSIPFVEIDSDSLSFNVISLPQGQLILVRGTIDKINDFKFYKCIDGSADCVSKDQMEMAL